MPQAVDITRPAGLAVTMGRWEAGRLHHAYVGPEHLLLGLLRDAEDPVKTEPYPQERRLRGQLGLPNHGPHAVKLLVEARGLTLEMLRLVSAWPRRRPLLTAGHPLGVGGVPGWSQHRDRTAAGSRIPRHPSAAVL